MSSTVTLRELRERLEQMTDTVGDEHLTVQEKNQAIVSAAAETVDTIVSSGLSDQTVKPATFTTIAGTTEYDLTDDTYIPDEDFYKVSKVFVNEGNGQFRPIERINLGDVQSFRAPQAAVSMKLLYIPLCTSFKDSSGNWDDDAEFDGIHGWEEHTLNLAAAWVKRKKEEDYRPYEARAAELVQRMQFMGNTDFSGPARVVRRRGRQGYHLPYQNQVSAWAMRGKSLCLYYAYPWVP